MDATYSKLRNGDWGVRVQGTATVGQTVTVRKKSGETKAERIASVVWVGNGISLCTVERSATSRRSQSSRSGRCRDCRGPIRDAPHHRAMGGLCGECAFDEYDM